MRLKIKIFFIKVGRAFKLLGSKRYVLLTKDSTNKLTIEVHNMSDDALVEWANMFLFGAQVSGEMAANDREIDNILNNPSYD